MIPSEWLATFADFSQDASLSGAARRLRLSQPAVHAQLARLAEHLGVPLYRRVGRGLALTREGVEVAAFARDARERGEELRREAPRRGPRAAPRAGHGRRRAAARADPRACGPSSGATRGASRC